MRQQSSTEDCTKPHWLRLGFVGLILSLLCGTSLAAESGLQLSQRFALPLDAPVHALAFGPDGSRAYLASGRELRVYDLASAHQTATLALSGTIVDMSIDPVKAIGYAVLTGPARLVSFRLRPLGLLRELRLSDGPPSALLYDAGAGALFVESAERTTLTKFEAASGRRIGVLRLPGVPGQMAVNQRGTLYLADSTHDAIDVVDEAHMNYLGAIALSGCKSPSGLAMDPVGRRLFVSCTDGMREIVDADMGYTFERLPSSLRGASNMLFAFHPFGSGAWKGAAIGVGANNRLALIRMLAFVKYRAAGSYPLPGRCEAIALNGVTHQLWLAVAGKPLAAGIAGRTVEFWTLGQVDEGAAP